MNLHLPDNIDQTRAAAIAVREAMLGAITPARIKTIMENLLKRAEEGDEKAIRQVFALVGAGGNSQQLAGTINVQNNFGRRKPAKTRKQIAKAS